jgi:hypothetical protein
LFVEKEVILFPAFVLLFRLLTNTMNFISIPLMFKDKFVSADTDQSPQIHLDLEQTVTEYYSFPSSKVLNGQEKKDEVLTLGKLSLSLLILALPQCSCVVQSQQHKPITAKTLIYSKL